MTKQEIIKNPNFVPPNERPVAPGLSGNFSGAQPVATGRGVVPSEEQKVTPAPNPK